MTTDVVVVSSSGKASITKDPNAILDYPFDWTDWLDFVDDEISSVEFLVTGGVVVDSTLRSGSRGTGKNYKTDSAGYAIGATAITLASGTGTILTGDLVKFGGDDKLYPVATFGGTSLVLASPGLAQAIPAAATPVTVRAVATPMLSGGTLGKASCTCRIHTADGRTEDRTLYLKIKDR